MDKTLKTEKPDNVSDKVWQQHKSWVDVTSGQVSANLQKYREQIKKYGRIKDGY
jgi:hypothetical protein|tara:strand:+ start:6490 stop:6651 length:162 start_codon:yes stop_codon:yes gene_type:complete